MGIKKLNKFLTETMQSANTYDGMHNYMKSKNKKTLYVAVDVYLYLHKYLYSDKNHLLGFLRQIIRLLGDGIVPIYIFEGTPPDEKQKVINYRFNKRKRIQTKIKDLELNLGNIEDVKEMIDNKQKINKLKEQIIKVERRHIIELKRMFDILNVKYIYAKGEADVLCAELSKLGLIDAVLSDDMDILVFGCKSLIKNIKSCIYEYNIDTILSKLNMTFKQFMDMCILFGCDYIQTPLKWTPLEIYDLVIKHKNIEGVIRATNNERLKHNYKSYIKARNIFTSAGSNENGNIRKSYFNITQNINISALKSFLLKYCDNNYYLNEKNKCHLYKINNLIKQGKFKINDNISNNKMMIRCF